jgi:valyl-tRNA synthetase
MDPKTQERLSPLDLRPQAHDIITFWLFNTMVKSRLHFNKNPWKETVISGFVTREGEKMSKSKGNIIRPQDVMEKYGADPIRFWAASSKLGEDFDYQEKDILTGKKTVTKLWNATNFVFLNLKDYKPGTKPKKFEKTDELFLEKLDILIKSTTYRFEAYEYSRAKTDVEQFFWQTFCDNYLEIVKNRIYNATGDKKLSAQYTLYRTLLTILKIFAPIMPYITEEIYQTHFKKSEKDKSIHASGWPKVMKERDKYDDKFDLMVEILTKVRQEKSIAKKSMKSEIILTLEKEQLDKIKDMLDDFKSVTNAKEIKPGNFKVEFVD